MKKFSVVFLAGVIFFYLSPFLLAKDRPPAKEALTYFEEGEELYKKMMYGKAKEAYLKAIELDPNFIKAYYSLAFCHWQLREWEEAIACFEKVVTAESGSPTAYPDVYKNIGCLYRQKGDYEKAISAFEKALEISSPTYEIYFQLGETYQAQGNWEKAKLNYHQVVALKPFSREAKEAQLKIAQGYLEQKYYQKAVFEYKIALDLDPKSSAAWLGLGIALLGSERYKEAVPVLKKAVKLNKRSKKAHRKLLDAYCLAGNFKAALKQLKRLQKLKVDPTIISEYKAYIYTQQQKYQLAIEEYSKIEKDSIKKFNNLALCYLKIGEKDKAILYFEKSLQINPNQAEVKQKLEELYQKK